MAGKVQIGSGLLVAMPISVAAGHTLFTPGSASHVWHSRRRPSLQKNDHACSYRWDTHLASGQRPLGVRS